MFDSRLSESFVSIILQSIKPRVTAITCHRAQNTDQDPELRLPPPPGRLRESLAFRANMQTVQKEAILIV